LGELEVDDMKMLKYILKKTRRDVVYWIGLVQGRFQWQVLVRRAINFQFHNLGKFLDRLGNDKFLMMNSAEWN
jgi:hypothetical protein